MGFCLSLTEQSIPNPSDYPEEDREFNRYTLLGEYDSLFVALLRERMALDKSRFRIEEAFRAHMNRGILLLQHRLKDIDHLGSLVASAAKIQSTSTRRASMTS
jgi:DNA sulfur modification protein DndE